ncbi:protein NPGR2-like [Impatiens glandulifera]|uniref:protein NPGR2-like n=1 Tax=Impatiens glandulifera TaxID=253017 RepID=UPI001FB18F1C|nr:protein NPGR2-like [Impatiens glandulifera]
MRIRNWVVIRRKIRRRRSGSGRMNKMMNCICSGEQVRIEDRIPSSESLATRDYSASGFSWRTGEDADNKVDSSNIEEAESSLRESGFLNYEEARALLGRLEYQKGNVEAALQVFQGIDIVAMTPRIKLSLSTRSSQQQRHSHQTHLSNSSSTIMSLHAVTLLFEAIFLKAKSLQALRRYTEAAQSCKVILDVVESALPEGLKENFRSEYKLHEIMNKTVELFPELWKLASASQDAILAYRKALLYNWTLDIQTRTRIQKEFAIFLLYSGCDASPPTLQSQTEGSFVPRNNIEESVLLLMVILRNFILGKIEWDSSVLDHLCFALSIGGDLMAFAHSVEELPPGIMGREKMYNTLALSYYSEGDNTACLNLLRNLLNDRENADVKFELLLASKVCLEINNQEEGINYLRSLTYKSGFQCDKLTGAAKFLSGRLLAAQSRRMGSDSEKVSRHSEAIEMLEMANGDGNHPDVLYHLSLEKAEQRKLDDALYYGRRLLKVEAGSSVKTWIHLARVLSAQKRYVDAENIINAALDETGKWEQGELLRTKARLQIAQGHLRNAVDSYTRLLAILQVCRKSFGLQKKKLKGWGQQNDRSLEMETWHDLADVYTSLSQWRDAETCLLKSKAINAHSASRWHSTGLYYKAKGEQKEALDSFGKALDVEPNHISSLISTAIVLRDMNNGSSRVAKSFLMDALRLDRTNPLAWYNLGLIYKEEAGGNLTSEAADCFQAATFLQDSSPVEPFFLFP